MAEFQSLKREASTIEDLSKAPPSKRRDVDPVSLETSIRDASAALIVAVKHAEEVSMKRLEAVTKEAKARTDHIESAIGEQLPPYVYVVHEQTYIDHKECGTVILGVFAP